MNKCFKMRAYQIVWVRVNQSLRKILNKTLCLNLNQLLKALEWKPM